jgi:RNA polymerase sigma-70 factor, ECF subfamily
VVTDSDATALDNIRRPASAGEQEPTPLRGEVWPEGLTFGQVLEQSRRGDPDAISLLYRRFLAVIYRFTLSRVGSVPEAEDLTSETFIAIMEGIGSARAQDELGFAAWILGIARNKLAQHFRRRLHQRKVSMPWHEVAEPAAVADEGDPLAVLSARESWAEVVTALNLLTAEQRTVLLYRCILGRSATDISHMLGKPVNAIYGLQFRALASLERHLANGDADMEAESKARTKHAEPPGERRNGHGA